MATAGQGEAKKNIDLINEADGSVLATMPHSSGPAAQGSPVPSHSFPYLEASPQAYAAAMDSMYTLVCRDRRGGGLVPLGYVLRSVFAELMQVPVDIRGHVDFDPATGTILAFGYVSVLCFWLMKQFD